MVVKGSRASDLSDYYVYSGGVTMTTTFSGVFTLSDGYPHEVCGVVVLSCASQSTRGGEHQQSGLADLLLCELQLRRENYFDFERWPSLGQRWKKEDRGEGVRV